MAQSKPIDGIVLDKPNAAGLVYPGEETMAAFNAAIHDRDRPLPMCVCPSVGCLCSHSGGLFQVLEHAICGQVYRFRRGGDQVIADFLPDENQLGIDANRWLAADAAFLSFSGLSQCTDGTVHGLTIGAIRVVLRRATSPTRTIPIQSASPMPTPLRDRLDSGHLLWLRRVVEGKRDAARTAIEYDIAEHCLRALDDAVSL